MQKDWTYSVRDKIIIASRLGLSIGLIGKYLLSENIQFREANVEKIS